MTTAQEIRDACLKNDKDYESLLISTIEEELQKVKKRLTVTTSNFIQVSILRDTPKTILKNIRAVFFKRGFTVSFPYDDDFIRVSW